MGRRKASEEPKPEMKKPKWKIGEIVVYNFLGTLYEGKILDLKKNIFFGCRFPIKRKIIIFGPTSFIYTQMGV